MAREKAAAASSALVRHVGDAASTPG